LNLSVTHPETNAPLLLERDAEIDRGQALLASTRAGNGGLLSFEGPPGIGKTRLLENLKERAAAERMTVLSATGAELESNFGFGVVRQLFEPLLTSTVAEERDALFDGAARSAEPALGIAGDLPVEGSEQRYAVVHGLFWLTANLATLGPVLIAVDDLQWADDASQRYLAYLARRLTGMPVALVAAFRPPVPGADRPGIDALASAADPVRLGPLGSPAVRALAESRLGTEVDDAFVTACRRVTGGNALLVEELLADLGERGEPPTAAAVSADQIGVERVARRVRRHLAALPSGAADLAAAVAIAGDGWPPDIAGAIAGMDHATAVATAASLIAADVLADGAALRFRHPLVRAAVLETIPGVEAAAAHGRAARALEAHGAAMPAVASQLLAAPPASDPWVVDVLRRAATEAEDQGTPELALTYLQRALQEPPTRDQHPLVLEEAGRAAHTAGDNVSVDLLAEAIDLLDEPIERARLSVELAIAHSVGTRWVQAAQVTRRALADLDGSDRELELVLSAQLADAVRMDRTIGGDEPQQLVELAATLTGSTPGERLVQAMAEMMFSSGNAREHAAAADVAIRLTQYEKSLSFASDTGIASNLIRASELDRASRFIEERLREARARGLLRTHATMVFFRGWVAFVRGALPEAEEDCAESLESSVEVDAPRLPVVAMLAMARAEQGRTDGVDDLLQEFDLDGDMPLSQVFNIALFQRATVRALQRRPDEALADALEVGRRYEAYGIIRALPPWRSLAAVLLTAKGEEERALELAREELELAEKWGTNLAIGTAQRGLGLVTGDVDMLAAAVDTLADAPARLELAKARLDLGSALRRAGRRADSREPLRVAMDEAHACGATPVAERARDELRATGARPRSLALSGVAALTPSERRVATLAADGMTNRHIAQELFVTTATVETHLRHVFQKLEISSREQLAENLMDGP
jgi:DNA-binding CsgD family transcriptional regulator